MRFISSMLPHEDDHARTEWMHKCVNRRMMFDLFDDTNDFVAAPQYERTPSYVHIPYLLTVLIQQNCLCLCLQRLYLLFKRVTLTSGSMYPFPVHHPLILKLQGMMMGIGLKKVENKNIFKRDVIYLHHILNYRNMLDILTRGRDKTGKERKQVKNQLY